MVTSNDRSYWIWFLLLVVCMSSVWAIHHYGIDRWMDGEAAVKFTRRPNAHVVCKSYIGQYSDKSNDNKTLAYWTNLDACVYGINFAREEK